MISALSTAIAGTSLTKSIFSTMYSLHTFTSSIISGDSLTNIREKDKSLLFQCIALQPTIFAFGLVDVALSNCFYGFNFQSSSTTSFPSPTNLLSLDESIDKESSQQSDFVLSSLKSLIQSVLSYTKQHTSKPAMGPFFTFLVSLLDATIYNLTCQFHFRSASISKTSPVMSSHFEIINVSLPSFFLSVVFFLFLRVLPRYPPFPADSFL
jgi:hypothetical protein